MLDGHPGVLLSFILNKLQLIFDTLFRFVSFFTLDALQRVAQQQQELIYKAKQLVLRTQYQCYIHLGGFTTGAAWL